MHIVHKLFAGPNWENYKWPLAVVGILFRLSEKSHPFVEKLHTEENKSIDYLNLRNLFSTFTFNQKDDSYFRKENAQRFYHYKGSLTNPPCSDIVNWFLLDDCIPISKFHLESLEKRWKCNIGHHNNRAC